MNWHCLTIKQTFELLGTTGNGLTEAEADLRLKENGLNILPEKNKKPVWLLFLNQFKDFMIIILMIAAIISGIIGDMTDTIIIMVIVVMNAILGFAQEYRAEKAIAALKKMAALQTDVLRNGKPIKIPSTNIVTGDVVSLDAGNIIPADLRLIESFSLRIDESSLTGESVPADKVIPEIAEEHISLGDRFNMAFKGTLITNGHGKALVVATGLQTELGKIAKLLQEEESETPLQIRMTAFGKKLTYIVLAICIILFVLGLLKGEAPMQLLLTAISVAVAAIPEALPALITISLAFGAKRLVKQNALIRKLPAVETLGSVTYICTDKTGTLTANKMKVTEVEENSEVTLKTGNLHPLYFSMALNHNVIIKDDTTYNGDPTEVALVTHCIEKISIEKFREINDRYSTVAEIPFDSERKCMTTAHQFDNKFLFITKGAAESVSGILKINSGANSILEKTELLSKKGLRVIAFAFKISDKLPGEFNCKTVELDMEFAGLAAMIDPARDEVKEAIAECKAAGIIPVMITGDHPATAEAIGRDIGLLDEGGLVLTGKQLHSMTEETFRKEVEQVRVYARVNPEQKLEIVKALQAKNNFVAMTGDGVNDAPSLRAANIGIAMGISGTDVSKEAAQMILLDDNFATIVKAVREGRRIYDNILKFIKYMLTSNSGEIWTIFLAPLVGLPIPLLPVHILWINLITDGLPGLALAKEPAEKNIMQRPPKSFNSSIFGNGMGLHILWVGLLMGLVSLATQAWTYNAGNTHWQTMVFTVLSLSQLGHAYAIRSDREFLYKKGLFTNKALFGAVVITTAMQLCVIYIPALNNIFKTQPLTFQELVICVLLSAIVFHAVEFEKWVRKRLVRSEL